MQCKQEQVDLVELVGNRAKEQFLCELATQSWGLDTSCLRTVWQPQPQRNTQHGASKLSTERLQFCGRNVICLEPNDEIHERVSTQAELHNSQDIEVCVTIGGPQNETAGLPSNLKRVPSTLEETHTHTKTQTHTHTHIFRMGRNRAHLK